MIRRMSCIMPTDVMEPTIQRGQRVVVDTRAYDDALPKRWDVVAFWAPELEALGGQLGQVEVAAQRCGQIATAAFEKFTNEGLLQRPHIFYIKRVVGVAGETLRLQNERIMRDDKEIRIPEDLRELYSGFLEHETAELSEGEWEIPDYHMFLLSDNLRHGKDSRQIGPVHADNLIGRVVT